MTTDELILQSQFSNPSFSIFYYVQLNFDIEVIGIKDGPPAPPNYFAQIDTNGDGFLDEAEIAAYFETMGQPVPAELWEHEDKNGDGKVSWDEFSGPKGTEAPSAKEEL